MGMVIYIEHGDHLFIGIDDGCGIHPLFAADFSANQRLFDAVGDVVSFTPIASHGHLNGALKGLGREKYGREEETGE